MKQKIASTRIIFNEFFFQLIRSRCRKRYTEILRSCNAVHTRKALRATEFPNLEMFREFRLSFPLPMFSKSHPLPRFRTRKYAKLTRKSYNVTVKFAIPES